MSDPARLAARIAALPRPLLLALDVDGTLAPIVEDPASARVGERAAGALSQLVRIDGIVIALVTGRDEEQLARMTPPLEAWRAVEHGRVVLAPGERQVVGAEPKRLEEFGSWARERCAPLGARVEVKRGAVAVHVRELAGRDAEAAAALLREARRAAEAAGLHAREGRHVVEAQIERGDKGAALLALVERTGARGVVYAGDDLTDEPAIAIAGARGIGVFVRSRERPEAPAGASAVVEGTDAMAELLEGLVERLGG